MAGSLTGAGRRAVRRGGAARPRRLWRRPSARRRVACGGEVCGAARRERAASDVVDFYEERRRSHRGHVRSREGGPSRRRRPQDASRKPLQCRVPQTLSRSQIARTARTTKGLSRRLRRLPKTLSRSQIARTTKSPSRGASSPRRSRRRIAAREAHREGEGAAAAVSVLFDGRATRGRAAGARRRGRPMSQVPENAVADGVLPLSVRGPEKDKRRVPGQG